ncbi:MAG: hypothetical protein AAF514_06900 [Verrucomicrobiota bacterium]
MNSTFPGLLNRLPFTGCDSARATVYSKVRTFLMAVFLATGLSCCETRQRTTAGKIGPLSYRSIGEVIEITGCDKSATGTITIPSSVAGLPVTRIVRKHFN